MRPPKGDDDSPFIEHCQVRQWNGSFARMLLVSEETVSLLNPSTMRATDTWGVGDVVSVKREGTDVVFQFSRGGLWFMRTMAAELSDEQRALTLCGLFSPDKRVPRWPLTSPWPLGSPPWNSRPADFLPPSTGSARRFSSTRERERGLFTPPPVPEVEREQLAQVSARKAGPPSPALQQSHAPQNN